MCRRRFDLFRGREGGAALLLCEKGPAELKYGQAVLPHTEFQWDIAAMTFLLLQYGQNQC